MKACTNCNHPNREGAIFCEECGKSLIGAAVVDTKNLPMALASKTLSERITWGTAHFDQDSKIVVHLRDSSESMTLAPIKRIIMGRKDQSSPTQPDVDLTPYGAVEKGVSRIHAAIYRNDETDTLTLIDMGSSNGTFLNSQRLTPEEPRVLRDGDEIRFGKLVALIYFKST
jgi:uncharacterized membrane protein YvbJ